MMFKLACLAFLLCTSLLTVRCEEEANDAEYDSAVDEPEEAIEDEVVESETEATSQDNGIPSMTLKSGHTMPMLGIGTYRLERKAYSAVKDALEMGYRLIDTAKTYEYTRGASSEEAIGRAIQDSGVDRSEVFITTKIMPNYFGKKEMREAVEDSLKKLRTDYIDLLLIHYPDCGGDPSCKETGTYLEGWKNMGELVDEGIVRDIGISNFYIEELQKLWIEGKTPFSVVQNWLDPYYQDRQIRRVTDMRRVVYQAYSILGMGWIDDGMRKNPILRDTTIGEIAAKHHSTPAQVILKWAIKRNIAVIPSTANITRLKMNFDSWQLELNQEELQAIDALDNKIQPLVAYGPTKSSSILSMVGNLASALKGMLGFGGTSGGEL